MAPGPVGYTCPDINEAISLTEDVISAADKLSPLVGRRGLLEELRNANEKLRSWGEQLTIDLEVANNRINELQDEIHELRNT